MIVRYALKCDTCGQPHTVRIGMGHDETQVHKFSCRGCSEEIVLRMDLNYGERSWAVKCMENCSEIGEVADAPIVNVDAIFVIPPEQQGLDMVFPRFAYVHDMYEAAKRAGSVVDASALPADALNRRPYRPPDYAAEWKLLRRAWSLAQSGNVALSEKRIAEDSMKIYPNDPLENLQDWVWRLALYLTNPHYQPIFDRAMRMIGRMEKPELVPDFAAYYETVAKERAIRYYNAFKDFFAGYAEFSQVYFFVGKGMSIPEGHQTTSVDFDAVEMFYGNTYEDFSALTDYLAMWNNMLEGRRYHAFEKMDLDHYHTLSRPNRFDAFALNPTFMAICEERNNKIRNASHHRWFVLDKSTQIIRYRAGKGGTGPERTISYSGYLERCVRLFLQAMTLLRLELMISNVMGTKYPV
jgi:hypothetical protein